MKMRLFLIRHGETVDNVAGLYAGSRDSALTSHGVLQARRLAVHLARPESDFVVDHVFSSDLQRAVKTAQAVCEEQKRARPGSGDLCVVQLKELREKDFGSAEGVRFGAGRDGGRKDHVGAETGDAMALRVDRFLDEHLLPTLRSVTGSKAACVVVAHGIILSVLYKSLIARVSRGSLTVAPEAQVGESFGHIATALPPWSNTGYLEGVLSVGDQGHVDSTSDAAPTAPLKLHVLRVNCLDHLRGLKKTRGGIGSSQFDAKQKTINSFFTSPSKKRKSDDVND